MTVIDKFKYLARLYNKTAWLEDKEMLDFKVWTLYKIVALNHDYPDYKTFMIDLGDYGTIDSNEAVIEAIYAFVKDMNQDTKFQQN